MRRFTQVDVFSPHPLAGNPVAVVLDSSGLGDDDMQAFARWTNLSETTFLLPPTTPAADYRLRIFTPDDEMAFAGHPTLGSCHAWLESVASEDAGEEFVQECTAGLVHLRRTADGIAFAAPPLLRSGPLGPDLTQHIAKSLRIAATEIVDGAWVDNGAGWAAVLLPDADAVLALQPGPIDMDIGVIGPHQPDGPADFEARAFFPKKGSTAEDPVTGSLNAGIAEWLISQGQVAPPYRVRQGTVIGHEGQLHISMTEDGTVWVAGETRTIISGIVNL